MKNPKSVTVTSRSVRRLGGGGGMEQRKILDQYLTSGQLYPFKVQEICNSKTF